MNVQVNKYGSIVGTRFNGASLRGEIETVLDTDGEVGIDFSGIESMSNSFADEAIAKLLERFNYDTEEFKKKVCFINCTPFIERIIFDACRDRILLDEIQKKQS